MNKEKQNKDNNNIIKEAKMDKNKNESSFLPIIEKEENNSKINGNLIYLQNSASKNLKNDIKADPANNYE